MKNRLFLHSLALLGILVSMSMPVHSLAAESEYVENYEITITFSYGERTGIYTGHLKDGLPDGVGKFDSVNSTGIPWTYIGDWETGHFQGFGISVFDDTQIHYGEYNNDVLTGHGGIITPDAKQTYIGDLVNGVPEGTGLYWSSDCVYEGQYANGSPNGTGKKEYNNGKSFEGTFINDYISGKGIFTLDNGDYIDGEFFQDEKGVLNGSGTYFFLSGESKQCVINNDLVEFVDSEITASAETEIPEIEINAEPNKKEIQFRDFKWNTRFADVKSTLSDYSIQTLYGGTYKKYPVDYVLSDKGGIELENYGINLITYIHEDIEVAGYTAAETGMYYALVPNDNGEYDWDINNSVLYGADYEIDATDGTPIFEDLLAKISSLYGAPTNTEETTGWAGAQFKYVYWTGENDTELCLRMSNYTTSTQTYKNPYEIYIAYAWRGGDNLLKNADKAMHDKKVAEEADNITANAGNTSGL